MMTFEILSSSEWNDVSFDPNIHVDISDTIDQKIEDIQEIDTKIEEWSHPRSEKGIRTKARQRGVGVGIELADVYRIVRWFDWERPLISHRTASSKNK